MFQIIFAHHFLKRSKNDLCKLHGSAIGCKYDNNCLYSHCYPHSVKICYQYSNTGKCINGNNCKYRHSLPYSPIFFIDDDHIKYDSAMLYILEKDIESRYVIIYLFDYTKYINYYDSNKHYQSLFESSFKNNTENMLDVGIFSR